MIKATSLLTLLEISHSLDQPFSECDLRSPALAARRLTSVFFGRAIRLAVVPMNGTFETHGSGHLFGQLADAQVDARAHVEESERFAPISPGGILAESRPVLQGKHAGFAEIIGMQKFP